MTNYENKLSARTGLEVITLRRVLMSEERTQGVLCDDQRALCATLEKPWKGNAPNISCIPAGLYKVQRFSGRRFKDVWQVMDVMGRSYILIHAGNTLDDTQGCILVGRSFGASGNILNSKDVLGMLQRRLPDVFFLNIINA